MQLYMESGMTELRAADQTAKQLDRLGYRQANGKAITAALVQDWRQHAMQGRAEVDIDRERFLRLTAELHKRFPDDPGSAAAALFDRLPTASPPLPRPRNPANPLY
jgi:hypothetical protein